MTLISAARLVAAAVFVVSVTAAIFEGLGSKSLADAALHGLGTVVATQDGAVEIAVPESAGPDLRIRRDDLAGLKIGDKVPVLLRRLPNHRTEVWLQNDRRLWAPMWTWIEIAFGGLLAAVYGKQLMGDPLSVIGFKSWR